MNGNLADDYWERDLEAFPSGKRDWVLTSDALDELLSWLDRDKHRAGEKYEEVRRTLIKIFVCRGCTTAEDLADETINRVIRKLPEIAGNYVGNPALYFSGVAKYVLLEYEKKRHDLAPLGSDPLTPLGEDAENIEREYGCLDQCMEHLTPKNRELILQYYEEEKQAKIDSRRRLAERLGVKLNALRVRADRIRATLELCVSDCIGQVGRNM